MTVPCKVPRQRSYILFSVRSVKKAVGVGTRGPQGPERGGVLGEGQRAPFPPARGSGGALSTRQWDPGRSTGRQELLGHFIAEKHV